MINYDFFIIDYKCEYYILVLKLFSNKNGLMAKLYNTLIMLEIVFMHVHFIRLCMLETYSYTCNNVSHTINFFIYFNKINKYISYVNDRQYNYILSQFKITVNFLHITAKTYPI